MSRKQNSQTSLYEHKASIYVKRWLKNYREQIIQDEIEQLRAYYDINTDEGKKHILTLVEYIVSTRKNLIENAIEFIIYNTNDPAEAESKHISQWLSEHRDLIVKEVAEAWRIDDQIGSNPLAQLTFETFGINAIRKTLEAIIVNADSK